MRQWASMRTDEGLEVVPVHLHKVEALVAHEDVVRLRLVDVLSDGAELGTEKRQCHDRAMDGPQAVPDMRRPWERPYVRGLRERGAP